MQVSKVDSEFAWCEGRGRRERLNILWLETVLPGDWVYAVTGHAREKLTLSQVTEINLALDGVEAALQGATDLDAYFPGFTPQK
jgi:hypothetical protein